MTDEDAPTDIVHRTSRNSIHTLQIRETKLSQSIHSQNSTSSHVFPRDTSKTNIEALKVEEQENIEDSVLDSQNFSFNLNPK